MQNQNPSENRFIGIVVSTGAACVMSLLMIGLLQFGPRHMPRFAEHPPRNGPAKDGFWEKKDFMGLVETQGFLRSGWWDGPFVQYYPGGSVLREMTYRGGRLEGELTEYFEKPGYHRAPPKNRLPNRFERPQMRGAIKRSVTYRNGKPDGPYRVYDESGRLKECGFFAGGLTESRIQVGAGSPDGRPDLEYWLFAGQEGGADNGW